MLLQFQNVYGTKSVLTDYSEDPVDHRTRGFIDHEYYQYSPITSIGAHQVVHGHFRPEKYNDLSNAIRITFLRHPVENVISIYNFWNFSPPEIWTTPLFAYFKENNLSLLRFAKLPPIRFLYSQIYFGGFEMSHFDFVGDYKNYNSELVRLGKLLEVQFDLNLKMNVTQSADYDLNKLNLLERDALYEILEEDILFYQKYAGK